MSVEISTTKDNATAAINRLLDAVSPALAAAAIGPRVKRLFQRHFLALPPNKRGWPTTHFWKRAAKATHWAPHGDGVMVTVSQPGVRQRLLGGPISKRDRLLTIPANADAYGTTAREHADLEFVPIYGPKIVGALVQKTNTPILHHLVSVPTLRVMFWLAARVNQKGDEHVLPAREEIQREAKAALQEAIQQIINHS
jgi:hypothetical protein